MDEMAAGTTWAATGTQGHVHHFIAAVSHMFRNRPIFIAVNSMEACEEAVVPWAAAPAGLDIVGGLPALPEPDHARRRQESSMGCTVVLSIVTACVTTTSIVLNVIDVHKEAPALKWAGMVAVWTQGIAAIGCLLGILYGDPGIVKRSPATCLPPHPEVCRRIQTGESLDGALHHNVEEPVAPFRSYCARCFVYRPSYKSVEMIRAAAKEAEAERPSCRFCGIRCGYPPPSKSAHHCATCQRCVEDFDHHVRASCLSNPLMTACAWLMLG